MVRGDFRPQGQPPSLEEVIAKVLQQWRGFRGGPILIFIAVVVVLILLWTVWFTVQPEETGIVQRFGKV
jgi:membrane protease subunit HflK